MVQQVLRIPRDEIVCLSAVLQVAAAIGISQRALLREGEKTAKSGKASIDGKSNLIGTRTVLFTPAVPAMTEDVKWYLKDPTETAEDSSIIEEVMTLCSARYAGAP